MKMEKSIQKLKIRCEWSLTVKSLIIFLGSALFITCQSPIHQTMENTQREVSFFKKAFETFKEDSLQHRRFKHADLEAILARHQSSGVLSIEKIGSSVLGKSIYSAQFGEGSKKVMLWSQMHGNEPTATMALMDLFNFLEGKDDEFQEVRDLIKSQTHLYFIPMLNPDGADNYTRRNALDIDLNRDARASAAHESSLLKNKAIEFKPAYGFNLHDQNIYYNVPKTGVPVTIALLAPAINEEREINEVRGNAMRLASGMNILLQKVIPGAVAKYDDEFSPRGFGDNFQMLGASTVLIESGGYAGDPEKQYIRELNFYIILNSLIEIAEGSYMQHSMDDYQNLPFNSSQLTDVLIRNVKFKRDSAEMIVDLSIKRDENNSNRDYFVTSRIDDLGDLQDLFGYSEVDVKGLEVVSGKLYPNRFSTIEDLNDAQVLSLLKQGYLYVQLAQAPQNLLHNKLINIHVNSPVKPSSVGLGRSANLILEKDGVPRYAIVNGYLVDLEKSFGEQFSKPMETFVKNRIL